MARLEGRSRGRVVSDLAPGACNLRKEAVDDDLPMFSVPVGTPVFGPNQVVTPNHVHHQAARAWFDSMARHGWATTAITELGLVRVCANPSQPRSC